MGCAENMSLEITIITPSHIYNEIVSVLCFRANETKRSRAALRALSHMMCMSAVNGFNKTQDVIMTSWHLDCHCVFYSLNFQAARPMMTVRHMYV